MEREEQVPRLRAMTNEDGELIVECPLCGEAIGVKKARNGRPHMFCPKCKTQIILHSDLGEKQLAKAAERGQG